MNPTLKGIDQWPNTPSLRQLCEAADRSNPGTCSICGSSMVKGMALENSLAGSDDGFGATLSQTGPAEIVDCMKCPTCGHSVHIQNTTALPPSSPATAPETNQPEIWPRREGFTRDSDVYEAFRRGWTDHDIMGAYPDGSVTRVMVAHMRAKFERSSPATPSEAPERVETAEDAFKSFWGDLSTPVLLGCTFESAFRAGYEAGRKNL